MKWTGSLQALAVSAATLVASSPVTLRSSLQLYKLKVVAPLVSSLNGRYLSINSDGTLGVPSSGLSGIGPIPPGAPVPPSSSSSSLVTTGYDAQPQAPPAAKFYVTSGGASNGGGGAHYELHSYPIGIIDHALGLNGSSSDGVRYLVDVANPNKTASNTNGGDGASPDWQSFTLGDFDSNSNGGTPGDEDALDISVVDKRIPPPLPLNTFSYGGAGHGKWLLFQGANSGYIAAWYDGSSIILQNYRQVDIVYEPADD
ncbi:hypothetical protein SEUCBS139899_005499 [Sporothrix eucalyptigena]